MALHLYNTLTGKDEEFVPLTPGKVGLYVCGVTVYDRSHIGHARALVTFDVIYRYLRFLGYDVTFVRNFTDVDDKIINRANERGVSAQELSELYIREFGEDMQALRCLPPTHEPRATRHIPEMIALIRELEAKGLAYAVDGDVYFAVDRFPGYGKLSHRRLEDMMAGARIEVDERKRHPMDFALWKASKPGEPWWESPWGKGRPGWHIECSAMCSLYLGQPFDIHGGGSDLIFPHHENEIAQSEGAKDCALARYWLHNGMVTVEQEKMSKSLGNFMTISEALTKVTPEVLRLVLLSTHYRMPLDFSEQKMEEAEKGLTRIYETLARVDRVLSTSTPQSVSRERSSDSELRTPNSELLSRFREAMDDDCNTARVLGVIFETIRDLNRALDARQTADLATTRHDLATIGSVLGMMNESPDLFLQERKQRGLEQTQLTPEAIEQLIAERAAARTARDFQRADAIRAQLAEQGVTLQDSPTGTTWTIETGKRTKTPDEPT
ncbi:MAG: cysteine--tRNA ligase [Deltaproteobacteria bacterium]|nr:cysteine--tRNA ligase [Deltaproteobacteria bacterium]